MNLLKGSFYFLFIMFGAVLLAAVFAPNRVEVRRSIKIDRPLDAVFNQVADFHNWSQWSPWFSEDSKQKEVFKGNVGDNIYSYNWQSDDDQGDVTMDSVDYNRRLNFTLRRDDYVRKGFFAFNSSLNTTEVEWVLTSERSYPFTILNYFIDGIVGKDFEDGLTRLKSYAETTSLAELLPKSGPVILKKEHGIEYATIMTTDLHFDDLPDFLEESYQKIISHIQTNGNVPMGPQCALYYKWDVRNSTTTVAAAVPISESLLEDEIKVDLDIGDGSLSDRYISCTHIGSHAHTFNMHRVIDQWLDKNRKEYKRPAVEEYIIGKGQETDTSLYKTRVVYYFD